MTHIRHGRYLEIPELSDSDIKRFWNLVTIRDNSECWEWSAYVNHNGYGKFTLNQKSIFAHRVAFKIATGTDAQDLMVCHKCDNTKCCNPPHLFSGTYEANNSDKILKGRGAHKQRNCSSIYYGVAFDKYNNRWVCKVIFDKKKYCATSCKTEEDAAKMYDQIVIQNNLPKPLNFPKL